MLGLRSSTAAHADASSHRSIALLASTAVPGSAVYHTIFAAEAGSISRSTITGSQYQASVASSDDIVDAVWLAGGSSLNVVPALLVRSSSGVTRAAVLSSQSPLRSPRPGGHVTSPPPHVSWSAPIPPQSYLPLPVVKGRSDHSTASASLSGSPITGWCPLRHLEDGSSVLALTHAHGYVTVVQAQTLVQSGSVTPQLHITAVCASPVNISLVSCIAC